MATNTLESTNNINHVLAVRGSNGLSLLQAKTPELTQFNELNNIRDESKNCRCMTFHSSGKYFAYCNGINVKVIDLDTFVIVLTANKPRTNYIAFSPSGTYLITWEQFLVHQNEQESDINNLNVYNIQNGQLIKSFQQKKQLESYIQWSIDEQLFAMMLNGAIRFFETQNFENSVKFIQSENITAFSLHSLSKCVAVHTTGKKNQPSSIRLFRYPNVTEPISNKSFFNMDKVEFKWNKSGNHLLLLCSTETSENSYYGDTTLNYMNVNGESQLVNLSKKGPIYSLEWNPNRDEYIVIYGSMPAKATLFNSKCEAIYDFGTGARNECFFNPLGNIVCLCGFGNIRGRIEVWNLSTSNRVPEQLCSITADDTTFFDWCPDGENILTATLSPRLRVSNSFTIWNYAGEKKYSFQAPSNGELWQVSWKPISIIKVKPIVIKKPAIVKQDIKAYVPPHLRGKVNQESSIKSKLHEDDEAPDTCLKIKAQKDDDPSTVLQKKIKTIKKKLQQIDEIKKKKASGVKLEVNQIEKLNSEDALIEELEKLEL